MNYNTSFAFLWKTKLLKCALLEAGSASVICVAQEELLIKPQMLNLSLQSMGQTKFTEKPTYRTGMKKYWNRELKELSVTWQKRLSAWDSGSRNKKKIKTDLISLSQWCGFKKTKLRSLSQYLGCKNITSRFQHCTNQLWLTVPTHGLLKDQLQVAVPEFKLWNNQLWLTIPAQRL